MLKSTFMDCNAVADYTGLSSFVQQLLPPKPAKSHKILRKFELITVQGHPWSSTMVPIESAYATSYQSFILTLDLSHTVFEILTHFARQQLVFPAHPCLTSPSGGTLYVIKVIYAPLKSTFNGLDYNSVDDNMGISSFVQSLVAPKATKSLKISRKFENSNVQQFKGIQGLRSLCLAK